MFKVMKGKIVIDLVIYNETNNAILQVVTGEILIDQKQTLLINNVTYISLSQVVTGKIGIDLERTLVINNETKYIYDVLGCNRKDWN